MTTQLIEHFNDEIESQLTVIKEFEGCVTAGKMSSEALRQIKNITRHVVYNLGLFFERCGGSPVLFGEMVRAAHIKLKLTGTYQNLEL